MWLTPLLVDDGVHEAIAGSVAPQLVVGGTDDELFDRERAAGLADLPHVEVLALPGADHALLTPGDVVRGARAHAEVCEAVVGFLARLDGAR